jgi:hypothetical protein
VPKLKLGAAFYAVVALVGAVQVALTLAQVSEWAGLHGWILGATAAADALMVALFAIGAVTRWGLISDAGPWICRHGWTILIGLVVVKFVLFMVQSDEASPWPLTGAVAVPHFVRRLQENYYEGRASAGERPAGSESVE